MATDTVTTPAEMASGTTKVFKNFIDGEWVASSTGETFRGPQSRRYPRSRRDFPEVR